MSETHPPEVNAYETRISERQFGPHRSVFYSEKGSSCPHPHCEDDVWPRFDNDTTELMDDLNLRGYKGTPDELFEKAGFLFHANDAATHALQPTLTSRLISNRFTHEYYAQFIDSDTPIVGTALKHSLNSVSRELVAESERAAALGVRTDRGQVKGMQAAGACWVVMGKKAYLLRVGNNWGYKISPGNNGNPYKVTVYRNTGDKVEITEQDNPHIGSRPVIDNKFIHIDEVDLEHGDILGLDSDGFHNYVDPANVENNTAQWIQDAFDKHYKTVGLNQVVSQLAQQADVLKVYPEGKQYKCIDDITLDLIEVGGIPFSRSNNYMKQLDRLRLGEFGDNQQIVLDMVSQYLNEMQTAVSKPRSFVASLLRKPLAESAVLEEDENVRSILVRALTHKGIQPNQIKRILNFLSTSFDKKLLERFSQSMSPYLVAFAQNPQAISQFAPETMVRLAVLMSKLSNLVTDKKIAVANYTALFDFFQKIHGLSFTNPLERIDLITEMSQALEQAKKYKELSGHTIIIRELLGV